MHLKIFKITKKNITLAKKYFSKIFELKDESLVARFFIAQILEKIVLKQLTSEEKKLLQDFTAGMSGININSEKYYFSISHKTSLVFIGVSTKKIALDIEILKIRDESLLDLFTEKEYSYFGGQKNWEIFYRIWTIKESIIKFHNLTLDTMQDIKIKNIQEETSVLSGQKFDLGVSIDYSNNNYRVLSGKGESTFFACITTTYEQI